MKLILITYLFTFSSIFANAQSDSGSDDTQPEFFDAYPGIYLTFENFITNDPIDPETILTDRNPESADFYFNLFKEGRVKYIGDSVTESLSPFYIWGYCDGESVYVNERVFPKNFPGSYPSEHPFARINMFGQLSLIA